MEGWSAGALEAGTSFVVLAQRRVLQKEAQCGEKSDVIITSCGIVSVEPYHTLVYERTRTHTLTVTALSIPQSCMMMSGNVKNRGGDERWS